MLNIKTFASSIALTSFVSISAIADTYTISGGLMGLDVSIPPFGMKSVKFSPSRPA